MVWVKWKYSENIWGRCQVSSSVWDCAAQNKFFWFPGEKNKGFCFIKYKTSKAWRSRGSGCRGSPWPDAAPQLPGQQQGLWAQSRSGKMAFNCGKSVHSMIPGLLIFFSTDGDWKEHGVGLRRIRVPHGSPSPGVRGEWYNIPGRRKSSEPWQGVWLACLKFAREFHHGGRAGLFQDSILLGWSSCLLWEWTDGGSAKEGTWEEEQAQSFGSCPGGVWGLGLQEFIMSSNPNAPQFYVLLTHEVPTLLSEQIAQEKLLDFLAYQVIFLFSSCKK